MSAEKGEKSVLVTGASKGIGQAIAIHLGQLGYTPVIHYGTDQQGAEKTAAAMATPSRLLQFDVQNRAQCTEVLMTDMEQHGAYYGIVNNAGICRDAAFPAMTDDEWDSVVSVNLGGFYNVVKPCIMPMVRAKREGRIVAISSVTAINGNRGQVNYSASKAALIGAVRSLAMELAKRKITVNCVAPGLIATDMVTNEHFEHVKDWIPLRRMGKPEEVAATVGFLFSHAAAYITRQVIVIDGGLT